MFTQALGERRRAQAADQARAAVLRVVKSDHESRMRALLAQSKTAARQLQAVEQAIVDREVRRLQAEDAAILAQDSRGGGGGGGHGVGVDMIEPEDGDEFYTIDGDGDGENAWDGLDNNGDGDDDEEDKDGDDDDDEYGDAADDSGTLEERRARHEATIARLEQAVARERTRFQRELRRERERFDAASAAAAAAAGTESNESVGAFESPALLPGLGGGLSTKPDRLRTVGASAPLFRGKGSHKSIVPGLAALPPASASGTVGPREGVRARGRWQTAADDDDPAAAAAAAAKSTVGRLACTSYFLTSERPLRALAPFSDPAGGPIACPGCAATVGCYRWGGEQCSCGAWVVPGMRVQHAAVHKLSFDLSAAAAAGAPAAAASASASTTASASTPATTEGAESAAAAAAPAPAVAAAREATAAAAAVPVAPVRVGAGVGVGVRRLAAVRPPVRKPVVAPTAAPDAANKPE